MGSVFPVLTLLEEMLQRLTLLPPLGAARGEVCHHVVVEPVEVGKVYNTALWRGKGRGEGERERGRGEGEGKGRGEGEGEGEGEGAFENSVRETIQKKEEEEVEGEQWGIENSLHVHKVRERMQRGRRRRI